MLSEREVSRAKAEWAEQLASERTAMVKNMCAIIECYGHPVVLREIDGETGSETLLDAKGRTVGTIQVRYIGMRPSIVCKIAFQLDDV